MVFDLWDPVDYLAVSGMLLLMFAIGLLVGGVLYKGTIPSNTIQAQPIEMPAYDLLQAYKNSQCSACLPECLHVYNMTRQFGKTVYAIEAGWIK